MTIEITQADFVPLQDRLKRIFDDAGGSDTLVELLAEFDFEGSYELAEAIVSIMSNPAAYERGKLDGAKAMQGIAIDVGASLAAAISLLERGGKAAKKAAPSDRMFDLMLVDYKASLKRLREALRSNADD